MLIMMTVKKLALVPLVNFWGNYGEKDFQMVLKSQKRYITVFPRYILQSKMNLFFSFFFAHIWRKKLLFRKIIVWLNASTNIANKVLIQQSKNIWVTITHPQKASHALVSYKSSLVPEETRPCLPGSFLKYVSQVYWASKFIHHKPWWWAKQPLLE